MHHPAIMEVTAMEDITIVDIGIMEDIDMLGIVMGDITTEGIGMVGIFIAVNMVGITTDEENNFG